MKRVFDSAFDTILYNWSRDEIWMISIKHISNETVFYRKC